MNPPGPRTYHPLGNLPERRRDPLAFMKKLNTYPGGVSRFRLGFVHVNAIHDPQLIKYVLLDNQKNYVKGMGYDKLSQVLGKGLFTNEGTSWLTQRKLASPAFHNKSISGFVQTMQDATNLMLSRWHDGQSLNIATDMMKLTMAIVGRTLLSTDVTESADNVGSALGFILEEVQERILGFSMLLPFLEKIPTKRNRKFNESLKKLDDVVFKIISERRKSKEGKGDLLSMFMEAQDEDTKEMMSDQQLRDEVMTMFLAGHETTANALSWCFYLLSQNPEVEKKLYNEVTEVLGKDRSPNMEDLGKLKFTNQVFEETLRLYPPAWLLSRQNKNDDEFGGYKFKAGSIMLISPYAMHHNPKFWPEPEKFDPDRFEPEKNRLRPKFTYLPFGGGPRFCIGNAFATMEAQIIIAMMVQKFRFELLPEHSVEPESLITLRPKYGIHMRLRLR